MSGLLPISGVIYGGGPRSGLHSGLRATRLDPVPVARQIAARASLMRWPAGPVFWWPGAVGALYGLPAASTLTLILR